MKPQRLDLCYNIIWKGRWHVGSGYQSAVADRLMRREGGVDGAPYVSGSQLKGVLRHQCERLALILDLEAINPHAGTTEDEQNLVKHFTPLAKSDLIVDRLFGSRYQGECLFVENARLASSDEAINSSVQTRTAIDRLTGTVRERHLFTTEIIDGGIVLRGTIRARHPAGVLTQEGDGFPYEYALLLSALLSLDRLGGDKSVGLGRCQTEIITESLHWNGTLDNALEGFQKSLHECPSEEWIDLMNLLREESTS